MVLNCIIVFVERDVIECLVNCRLEYVLIPILAPFLIKQLLMDKRVGLKRYEVDGRKVLFYFDEVPVYHHCDLFIAVVSCTV